jgi:serine phosphatase RsbU (regulator of sigma subunit)
VDLRADDHLRNIQALTDSALGRLNVEDLLVELLDRVRDALNADTAAVLLLDEGSQELVARAARGIEEEVYQGVRVPLRTGFAGRIAAERRPVALGRVDDTTVANPILWEKGIQSMLGVPLLTAGRLIGVLHVGTLEARQFTSEESELLELAAERVALATQARLLEIERAAAALLERSLLPPTLPMCPGLQFGVRYVAAEGRGVGGDWYDVFRLPSGDLWLVMGDVAGHGLRAAVVMGRLRSTIRAYALQVSSPEEVLQLTDRKLQHFEIGEMATVLCAASSPPFDQFQICSAGHPPPILQLPGQDPRPLAIQPDPPLGTPSRDQRSCEVVPFPPGAMLLLYTDGLIERRGESIDVGLDRLRAAVPVDVDPYIVCRQVMLRLVGSTVPSDDIALVAVRHDPGGGAAPGRAT